MKNFTDVMKALADANRVKIVKLLQHRTMCVCELQGVLGLAQPTVSKHLKILEEAGLVVSSKDGLFDRARGRIVGSEQYLTKPFTKDELLNAIHTQLGA